MESAQPKLPRACFWQAFIFRLLVMLGAGAGVRAADGDKWTDSYDYTVSPSGKRIAITQRGENLGEEGIYRVFVVDPDHPRRMVRLGDIRDLDGVEILFSPDDRWIAVNHFPCSGECLPSLFRLKNALTYQRTDDVERKVRKLYAKSTGDLEGSEAEAVFVKAFRWKPDSSGFHVYMSSKYHALKVDIWTCFYDVKTGAANSPSEDYDFGTMLNGSGLEDENKCLSAMCRLVSQKLGADARNRLKRDEKRWLESRKKLEYDRQYKMTGERIRSLFEMLPDKG